MKRPKKLETDKNSKKQLGKKVQRLLLQEKEAEQEIKEWK